MGVAEADGVLAALVEGRPRLAHAGSCGHFDLGGDDALQGRGREDEQDDMVERSEDMSDSSCDKRVKKEAEGIERSEK